MMMMWVEEDGEEEEEGVKCEKSGESGNKEEVVGEKGP